MELGIDKYNEACRGIVMRFSSEWEKTITRLGRWIDFKNDYKTMNPSFMESVWWVFGQLWEKNLVYRGFKVMPYSTACTTPLSNFEANMNYQDANDPEVVVSFQSTADPNLSYLAWTTTPWTLPSNVALCVNPDFDYVEVLDKPTGRKFILAECRIGFFYKKKQQGDYEILKKMKGTDLIGQSYEPLFNYFSEYKEKGGFRIVADGYVTDDSGTGIVHNAPGFGEDDYRVCLSAGIISKDENIPCPIDESGRFIKPVTDYIGKYIKDADSEIISTLKKKGQILRHSSIKHSYPFCWRSDTPLIYRAVPSWFVRVESIRDKLLENNQTTYWVPDFVKEKRFHNWLEGAKDWAISRSRYWGTPIPVWTNEDYSEFVVIDSIAKLEQLTGKKITDLHRESIDNLTIPAPSGNGVLKRVEDVFDCWFESGSMPYAQCHYPFENKEDFMDRFPADFIAEGLDQTRGWFYTLMVLGTALFGQAPFKNLIVNGIVLAADGRKMSKRLKNYPDPTLIIDKYGADALRLYLIDSPVVRAEPLKFQEEGVESVKSNVFRPWFNSYIFFVQSANSLFKKHPELAFTSTEAAQFHPTNVIDKWILSLNQSLIKFVREEMSGYRLYTVIPKLVNFIDQFSNWYLRVNRPTIKGEHGPESQKASLMVVYSVLFSLCRLMAPFTPFITETIYQNLKNIIPESEREDSVHYLFIPEFDESFVDTDIERAVSRMQEVITSGRDLRNKKNISMRIPVRSVSVCTMDKQYLNDIELLKSYICYELNCCDVVIVSDVRDFFQLSASANSRELGRRLKQKLSSVVKEISNLKHEDIAQLLETKSMTILDETLKLEDFVINRKFTGDENRYISSEVGTTLVILDFILDQQLKNEGAIRELSSAVMRLRKESRLIPEDLVDVYFVFDSENQLKQVCTENESLIQKNLPNMKLYFTTEYPASSFAEKEHQISSICGEYSPFKIIFSGTNEFIFKSLTRQTDYYKRNAQTYRDLLAETKKTLRITREKQLKGESLIQDLERQAQQLKLENEKLIKKLKDQAPSENSTDSADTKQLEDLRKFAQNVSNALANAQL